MDFQKIVKKEVGESSEKRTVYFWEDGTEIVPGLYKIKYRSLGRFRFGTILHEMLIWKNQEKGIIHDMFIASELQILDLPEVANHDVYEFELHDSFLGEKGMKILQDRMTWKSGHRTVRSL